MKKIVLCSTQRSGSTMICEDMRNAGVFGFPEEYFIPWRNIKPENDYNSILNRVVANKSTENGVFAVKVMADQLSSIDHCLSLQKNQSVAVAAEENGHFERFFDYFSDATWVYIVRRDALRQAVSQVMAKQTGINHATKSTDDEHFAGNLLKGYDTSYNERVQYNFPALRRHLLKITEDNALWLKFFQNWNIAPYTIEYEVNKGEVSYLSDFAKLLDIEFSGFTPKRKMVKLSNNKNDEWYDNYIKDLLASR